MTEARQRRGPERSAFLLAPLTALLVTILLVFYVAFDYNTVEGDSMLPTLHHRDKLLLTPSYDTAHRGDIIVFSLMERGRKVDVLKRVVALPGDRVETRGDRAWVNGKPEPRTYAILAGPSMRVVGPVVVPAGKVFVLGDNRPISLDSRFIGPIDLSSVHGRAVAIFTPVTRLRKLD